MASKSTSKRTTITTSMSSSSQAATPGTSTSYSERPSSPLSPTRLSRLQEKADLQNLNDRLAQYIDLVRKLENDRSRLTRQIQTIEETKTKEIQTFKNIYENELQEARQLIDDLSREKARLEIDSKRLYDENGELKERLEKKTKDYIIAEKNIHVLEARVNDLGAKYNQAVADRKKALDELKDLEKEYEKLKAQVNDLRDKLQHETLLRIDVENSLQTLREDLQLKEQIFNEQLTETQTRRQVEISEIDGRLTEQYEERLKESLQGLREEYEAQMKANRDEIEQMFSSKLRNAMSRATVNNETITKNAEEMRNMRSRLDSYQARIGELENNNTALLARLREFEKTLETERLKHMEERSDLESQLQRMRDEMDAQLREYQELMDIKVALDLEIAFYRKMIESEEARLNITPNQSGNISMTMRPTPIRRTPLRGGKRKRTTLEESESESRFEESNHAKGDVEISEACPEGKFVKIHNKGNKDIILGGWQLLRKAGDAETTFKFHRSVKIEPGATITVWSADQGQTHEPPNNLVMKSQKWFVADSMTTVLISNSGEEVAVSERKRLQVSHSVSRHQEFSGYQGYRSSAMDELYHQQGDPQGEDRCKLM